jgi:hypothetical protein
MISVPLTVWPICVSSTRGLIGGTIANLVARLALGDGTGLEQASVGRHASTQEEKGRDESQQGKCERNDERRAEALGHGLQLLSRVYRHASGPKVRRLLPTGEHGTNRLSAAPPDVERPLIDSNVRFVDRASSG